MLDRTRLIEIGKDPNSLQEVSQLIDGWCIALSRSIGSTIPPRQFEPLIGGREYVLSKEGNAYPKEGVVWVRHLEGNSRFMGFDDLPLLERGSSFPLSNFTWLQSLEESKISVLSTEAYVKTDPLLSGLDRFHRVLLERMFFLSQEVSRAEYERLRTKERREKEIVLDSFSLIASQLQKKRKEILFRSESPLLAACQLVGNAIGVTIKPPPQMRTAGDLKNMIQDILRASRIRARQVALRDDWWHRDNDPLLAFITSKNNGKEEKLPVALLPLSPKKYELCNPSTGTRVRVTPEVASTLDYFAYTFYRPFPDRSLSVLDLFRYAFKGRIIKDLLIIIALGILAGLLGLVTPYVTGIIFDSVIPEAQRSQLLQISLIMLVVAFATALFNGTQSFAATRLEARMGNDIQSAVWDRLLALPIPFFSRFTAGDLADRTNGINVIRQVMSSSAIRTLLSGIFSVFNFALLYYYNWKLAIAGTILVLIAVIYTGLFGFLKVRQQRDLFKIQGKIMGKVLELVNGIPKFRISGSENSAFHFWVKDFAMQIKKEFKTGGIENIIETVNAAYPIIAMIVIYVAFMELSKDNPSGLLLSTGKFLAFNSAFTQLIYSMLAISSTLISLLNVVPLFERVKPILKALPEIDEAKVHPGELSGEIEVGHVEFRYREDAPIILKDVSLHIDPGEFIAVVGPSGCGKSTLFRVLLGFETPSSGAVYFDGQDLSGLDLRAVRQQIGVVLQHSQLMQGDILTNIVGSSGLTVDDAWQAARMVGLDEDIKAMPMGMYTMVSYGGGTLSGGQRQRLLIARALVKKPRIIFFDEATSALDNRTQAVVSGSLERLQATRIVIAHRLSTIKNANRIFVMRDGRIVEIGNYEELIRKERGVFSELAKRQIA